MVAGVAALTLMLRCDPLATAVLAVACSFALATPIAMLASIGAAAKRGLLIKGGKCLEALARADVLLVDKTGTLIGIAMSVAGSDGLAPTLAGLRWQLTALRQSVREQPEEPEAVIDGLRRDVRTATAEIRRLVYDLRPPMLDEFGLLGTLQHLGPAADSLARVVDAPEPLPPLPAALEVAVYRIAAEAVQNVVRHAAATRCGITLAVADGMLRLTISDDGRGLRTTSPAWAIGRGTRVTAEFPLKGGRHG